MKVGGNRPAGSLGSTLIAGVARIVARRPRLVVAIWLLAICALAFQGRNLDNELTGHAILIDGTPTKRAHDIAVREFGNDYSVIVMLRGPQAAIERQGRDLGRRLSAMPGMLVVSPWDAGGATIDGLSPRPGVGALLVRVRGAESSQVSGLLPPIEGEIEKAVRGPVHSSLAGFPVLAESIRKASAETSATGDLIAIPVLLFVLLFVFRSVLAALTPLVIGGCVVGATRGVTSLLTGTLQLDYLVVGLIGMMGLALGVDYTLLVVSRFREEREKNDLTKAVETTVIATSRSILPAGFALLLAMIMALIVIQSSLAQSVTTAVIVATLLSMVSAICFAPALLSLLNKHLDRWVLPSRNATGGARLRWSRRIANRPGAVMAIVLGLFVLAGLAFNLQSGVGSIAMLPTTDPGRIQQEEVEEGLGPGWSAPMEIIVDGRGSPLTSPQRLQAIAEFQRHVEADPGVASMTGLRKVADSTRGLTGFGDELEAQERGLNRLESGLSRVSTGASKTSDGLTKAAAGSRELGSGIDASSQGAGTLAGALRETSAGSGRQTEGLGRASEGSGELTEESSKVSTGAGRLAEGLNEAAENTGEIQSSARLIKNAMRSGDARLDELAEPLRVTEERLAAARQALQQMTTGRGDPEYAAVLAAVEEASRRLTGNDPATGEPIDPSYQGVAAGAQRAEGEFGVGLYLAEKLDKSGGQANSGLGKLARSSERLDRGLHHLVDGSRQLSQGVDALAESSEELSPALQRLSQGAERLTGGLTLLESGASDLTGELGEGAEKSKSIPRALRRIGSGLEGRKDDGTGESQLDELQRQSPGMFDSAYFILANLDGGRPSERAQLGSLININRGGEDARLLVIPRGESTADSTRETGERIEADAKGLARRTNTEVVVGGIANSEIGLNESLREQAPMMRLGLSLISLLILIPLLRSLIVPIFAALINLLTVSATFGLLSLLFNGSLLGGPGFVDTTVIPATIIVMFGLAIDYEVFVFARIREEYLRTGSTSEAVSRALDRTGHVVTGAAVIMIVIFLAFSAAGLIAVRNFAVAQACAIFIDAFIVRLILVPVLLNRLGKWSWWLPGWLDRLLPGSSTLPDEAPGRATA